ncbi:MAG TPA: phosphate ABC transporter substrate-binding protein [Chloroflexi bacterium]|nr:phosphate ABC transporter substrate-binding protein [Chloroflexota bacterium]
MRKVYWSRWVITVLIGLVMAMGGCQKATEQEGGAGLRGTVRVSGAWALYPMMVRWGEEFHKIYPQVTFDISAGGAGKGMADALGGLVDIGMVSREIYPEEIERGAFWVPVIKDAVMATVNENNPVLEDLLGRGVSREILEGIWITGDITTWGEVVGRSDVAYEIHIYTRSDACGAAQTWAHYLGGYAQGDLIGLAVYGDPGLAEAVNQDPLGIGYNNLNFAYAAATGKPVAGIKILPLDLNANGRLDEAESFYDTKGELMEAIATGIYPSPPARALNLVTLGQPTGLTRAFMVWILTEGQRYVEEVGYIPLPKERLEEGLRKLE